MKRKASKIVKYPQLTFLFAHGAGAGKDHPWMLKFDALLGEMGTVRRFNYKRGSSMKNNYDIHLKELQKIGPEEKIVLVGKSYGCRHSAQLLADYALENANLMGAVFFGFPLVSSSNGSCRQQVLLDLDDTSVLFFTGTRDKMGPREKFEEVVGRMNPGVNVAFHWVDTGDHSLLVTKTHEKKVASQIEVDTGIQHTIFEWLQKLLAT